MMAIEGDEGRMISSENLMLVVTPPSSFYSGRHTSIPDARCILFANKNFLLLAPNDESSRFTIILKLGCGSSSIFREDEFCFGIFVPELVVGYRVIAVASSCHAKLPQSPVCIHCIIQPPGIIPT